VLRVNSPGGTVAACQEIFDSVVRLKEKGIPVVASMGDVAASGGVYISMAATEIVANSGTVTGSIGVIIRSSDLSNLYEKVGKDEERLLQGVIDDSHRQFVEVIAAARQKASQEIEEIADGRILTGRQAHKAGLIDHLGDLDLAVDRASSLAGIEGEPNLVSIQIRKGLLQKLFGPFSRLGQKSAIGESLSGIPLWILPTHP
jgi:protease-4